MAFAKLHRINVSDPVSTVYINAAHVITFGVAVGDKGEIVGTRIVLIQQPASVIVRESVQEVFDRLGLASAGAIVD